MVCPSNLIFLQFSRKTSIKNSTQNLFHQLSHLITQKSHFHFIQIGFSNSPRLTKYLQTLLLSHRPRKNFPIQRKNNGTLCVDVKNEGKKNYKSTVFYIFPLPLKRILCDILLVLYLAAPGSYHTQYGS